MTIKISDEAEDIFGDSLKVNDDETVLAWSNCELVDIEIKPSEKKTPDEERRGEMTMIEIRKLKVGQVGFVCWPEVNPYSIYKQEFDFGNKDFRILKVKVCDRHECKYYVDGTSVMGWRYKICLVNREDGEIFEGCDERPWDKPFEWCGFIGETNNEAVREACRENNAMIAGFMGIARNLEALIDPDEKIGCYPSHGRLL